MGSPRRKQNHAAAKNINVGNIPQNTPSTNDAMTLLSPLLSEYSQIKTIRVVNGIAAISPLSDGTFFPIITQEAMTIFERISLTAKGMATTRITAEVSCVQSDCSNKNRSNTLLDLFFIQFHLHSAADSIPTGQDQLHRIFCFLERCCQRLIRPQFRCRHEFQHFSGIISRLLNS